jgi:hypothetical protein
MARNDDRAAHHAIVGTVQHEPLVTRAAWPRKRSKRTLGYLWRVYRGPLAASLLGVVAMVMLFYGAAK